MGVFWGVGVGLVGLFNGFYFWGWVGWGGLVCGWVRGNCIDVLDFLVFCNRERILFDINLCNWCICMVCS